MTKYEVLAALFAFDMDVDKTLAVGVHFSEEPDLVLSNCPLAVFRLPSDELELCFMGTQSSGAVRGLHIHLAVRDTMRGVSSLIPFWHGCEQSPLLRRARLSAVRLPTGSL